MIGARSLVISVVLGISWVACFDPEDQRPGLWLSGEASDFPRDWSFSNAHREIALEVETPYFIAHSVTIWCVALNDALYIGARNPDEKNWPGWVESDPGVRLQIAPKQVRILSPLPASSPRLNLALEMERRSSGTGRRRR